MILEVQHLTVSPWRRLSSGSFYCCLLVALFIGVTSVCVGAADDKGLARTPPMGWNSWNHYRLNINDAVLRRQAEAMVKTGMKAAGYEYVVIDGGWEGYHDAQGFFRPNQLKFPDMKALCDHVHSLGLKVGIHTTPGPVTCSGREGSYGYEEKDAQTFARWGIDLVKYDWCSGNTVYKPSEIMAAYEKMHQALLRTGRPILYSLSEYGLEDVWKWGASVGGHMWRTTEDISDEYWNMAYIGFEQNGLEKYAGPGHWNDPDMLEVGNGGMTDEEYRTHMSLWCILAAPLFAGNDLENMSAATLEILTNPEVISVDQDPAGIQGRRLWQEGPREVWMKPLKDGSRAVGLFNRLEYPLMITVDWRELGLPTPARVRDLWARKDLGTFAKGFTASVAAHGVVLITVR